MKPYVKGLDEETFSLKKISQQLSVNMFRRFFGLSGWELSHWAASGAVALGLVCLPKCPLRWPAPQERDGVWCQRHLPGNLASTGASASGFSDTLDPALYFAEFHK